MAMPASTTYTVNNDMKLFDDTYNEFASADQDQARTRAYETVNALLASKVPTPIQRNSNGDYDGFVKTMESLYALSFLYAGQSSEKSDYFYEKAEAEAEKFSDGRLVLDCQQTSATIGVQQAIKDSANSGAGIVLVDTSLSYRGTRRRTYTIEITTGGAVGTAVYTLSNSLDTDEDTGIVSSKDFYSAGYGVTFYFSGNESDSFVKGDKFYINAVPETEEQEGRATRSISLIKSG